MKRDGDVTLTGPKEPSQRAEEENEAAETRERQRLARQVLNSLPLKGCNTHFLLLNQSIHVSGQLTQYGWSAVADILMTNNVIRSGESRYLMNYSPTR